MEAGPPMSSASDVVLIPCPMCRDLGAPTTLTQGKLSVVISSRRVNYGNGAIAVVDVEVDTETLRQHVLEVHAG